MEYHVSFEFGEFVFAKESARGFAGKGQKPQA